ncbi:hypothetical protein HMN09_00666900 [Mycena chlorophos]|uniref:Uncharacterized protein n=1 Tax=Mycena chlorophos TaxID=658473 RepID=A0A8H6W9L9_MYCCL|nr:hypothetical protein HMN09_00666900 [Mycena chlorophos]
MALSTRLGMPGPRNHPRRRPRRRAKWLAAPPASSDAGREHSGEPNDIWTRGFLLLYRDSSGCFSLPRSHLVSLAPPSPIPEPNSTAPTPTLAASPPSVARNPYPPPIMLPPQRRFWYTRAFGAG